MGIRNTCISDLDGISFQFCSLTYEVFINIHETLDQKIRLYSYGTLPKQPFATNFYTLILSVLKLQIILKVYLFNFSVSCNPIFLSNH